MAASMCGDHCKALARVPPNPSLLALRLSSRLPAWWSTSSPVSS